MDKIHRFNALVEHAITSNWEKDALTDYKGATLQYHDVARKIEKLRIMFEHSGLKPGDKIAVCGRNSASWACACLAIMAYGAVAVPIQHEFTPEQVHNIVNHSDARLLFAGDVQSTALDPEQMPRLEGMIYLPDFSLMLSRSERLSHAREHLNELFGRKYPKYFRKEHVSYHADRPDELAMINYTSGTTGFSKGVMLPYRALWSNIDYLSEAVGSRIGTNRDVLSILPMAHMYGLTCEFLLQICLGNHVFFLNRLPSPTVIREAFAAIRPAVIFSVPMVIEKIVRKHLFPLADSHRTRLLLKTPGIGKMVRERLCQKAREIMGGNAYEVITGGAALNREVEAFLTAIGFPITVIYGTTETAPVITFSDHTDFVPGSCGTAAKNMEVRILSPDPANTAGEIVTRGPNVMLGYYKNEEATREVIDRDGWFHTGDLATMSEDGHVFVLGRIKNMLLGSNGQNVYPEEIEDKLNSMSMVAESLVLQKGDRLVGLVCPDLAEAEALGFSEEDLEKLMEQNRKDLNAMLPPFCRISEIRLHPGEFEKTAKKSVKRYLYKDKV